ncbi:hypothetical protein PS726_06477 [Pseudomonas fluorescens]|nr:hypothetical protein PS726_06441 [Pseudomonas fluorescens]VVO44856.1 hypothetical protein PS726_06477 [Pseudomonas fluorescens]
MLSTFGRFVDRLRAPGVEERHRQQARDVGEACSAEIGTVQVETLAAEGRAEKELREPLGFRLLATSIGGVELCHQRQYVRSALQQLGGLAGLGLGHVDQITA